VQQWASGHMNNSIPERIDLLEYLMLVGWKQIFNILYVEPEGKLQEVRVEVLEQNQVCCHLQRDLPENDRSSVNW
jgi:hypothetical protein